VLREGGNSWFILAADYAFGQAMSSDVAKVVQAAGGTVARVVKHPLNTSDFSSFIVQAKSSGANVVALANGGSDTVTSIKQFSEFGQKRSEQKLVGLAIFLTDVHAMGLQTAEGLLLTTGFYWDRTPATREWSKRFFEKHRAMPTMAQAGVYSAVTHYLKAIASAGSDDGEKVAAKMRELPIRDFFAEDGRIRADGRMVHDMYLAQVKAPDESKQPWDYYKILRIVPGDEAVRPISESECPLLKR
jgi:branched-chain amino acid transport system substrate-binding protein